MKNKLPYPITDTKDLAVKVVSFHVFTIVTVVVQVFVLLLSTKVALFPGGDVMQSIVGTCAEIIAGLYGITMAGYTFFLSRMDALTAADTTLDFIVAGVKKRFKYLIWFITGNVLMVLFTSIVLMYCPEPTQASHAFFYRFFCNEFVLTLCFSVGLILYYSILVVDPNCLEKEAAKQKKRLSKRTHIPGDPICFISLYDKIEARCNAMLPENVLHQLRENKGNRFEMTIELLFQRNLLAAPLVRDLNRVHRYYECVVNCSPMTVTSEMCLLAENLLKFLEQANLSIK